ncbi:hypothetical protein LC605_08610 [Nostoc sp. CHAB 5836]|uniref:hypothetical protein n=1 Tax=Nostoc sp. CHAB 5836 TaxID=2780404 RepID=UPI001E470F9F|nr:hypothetical protein [Nostoc sp. CHAB 5836]MCC5615138.1 hypothetical protein [Nostoc sp. CHAB 5836]
MQGSKVTPKEWLEFMKQPFIPGMSVQSVGAAQVMAPANALGVGDYVKKADDAATPGPAPGSIFEGMQTIADLSRTRANYNPLDPQGTGNKQHFLQFTQNIADAPFLSLINASTTEVHQRSTDASVLVNSFVGAFVGIADNDKKQVEDSVTNLVNAALSWSNQQQRLSNFAQNLLQTNPSGVEFHLYSSVFEIYTTNNKGVITFESSYYLLRAVYQLSQASWNDIKPIFDQQKKTSTEDWLNNMKTPTKSDGSRALCLS